MDTAEWQILLFRVYAVANAVFPFLVCGIAIPLLYRITKALERMADGFSISSSLKEEESPSERGERHVL